MLCSGFRFAPPFQRSFDPSRHLLHGDVKFIYPEAHLKLKWAKNIQTPEKVHWIKIPTMSDSLLCPVTALQQVLAYIPSSPSSPLFAFPDTSLLTQSTLRRRLASILRILGKPLWDMVFTCSGGQAPLWPTTLTSHSPLSRIMVCGAVMPSGPTFQTPHPNPYKFP